MVIRRIREHVASQNWFAVAIDFLIVVAGIVIGTQVNNWNEARIEAQQGRDYRQRLIGELQFNALQFGLQHQYYRQVMEHGLNAIATLEGRTPPDAARFLIDAYQLSQIDTTSAKTYIYDEMVSSGLVARLGSEDLQQNASDYYLNLASNDRTLREVLPYRTTIRRLMPFAVQSAIRDRCGDRFLYQDKRLVGVKLPQKCDAVLASLQAEQAARRILAEPGLRDEMTRYVASIDEKLDALELSLTMTRRFSADLATGR